MIELKQLISQNEACSFQQLNKFEKELKKLITDYVPSKELYQKLKEIVPLDVLYNQKKTLMHIAEKISRSLLKDFIEEEIFFSNDFKEKDAEDFEILIYGLLGEEKDQYQRSLKKLIDTYGEDKIEEFLETAQKKMKLIPFEDIKDQTQNKIESQSEKSILLKDLDKAEEKQKKNEIAYEKIPSVYNSLNQSLMSIKSKKIEKEKPLNFQQMFLEFLASYIAQYVQKHELQQLLNTPQQNEGSLQDNFLILKQQILVELNQVVQDENKKPQEGQILFTLQKFIPHQLVEIGKHLQKIFNFLVVGKNQKDQEKFFSKFLQDKIDMSNISQIKNILINFISNDNVSLNDKPIEKCMNIEVKQNFFRGIYEITSKVFKDFNNINENDFSKQNPYGSFNNRDNKKDTNIFGPQKGQLHIQNYKNIKQFFENCNQQDPNKLEFERIDKEQSNFTKKDVLKKAKIFKIQNENQNDEELDPNQSKKNFNDQEKQKNLYNQNDFNTFVRPKNRFLNDDQQRLQLKNCFFNNQQQQSKPKKCFFDNDEVQQEDQSLFCNTDQQNQSQNSFFQNQKQIQQMGNPYHQKQYDNDDQNMILFQDNLNLQKNHNSLFENTRKMNAFNGPLFPMKNDQLRDNYQNNEQPLQINFNIKDTKIESFQKLDSSSKNKFFGQEVDRQTSIKNSQISNQNKDNFFSRSLSYYNEDF